MTKYRKHHKRGKKRRLSRAELERRRRGREDQETHDKNLEAIMQNPASIGLNNIYSCFKESKWYDRKFIPGGTPDLIMSNGKLLYILEYKTHHTLATENKGEKQLKTIRDWFYKKGVEYNKMRLMIVYGSPENFEVVYYTKEQLDRVELENYKDFRKFG